MKKHAIIFLQLIGAFIAVGFLFVNLTAVLSISPLYSKIADRDEDAMVVLFKKAKSSKEFREIFPEIRQLFVTLEGKVYAEERHRRGEISYLESFLSYNPNARDVLYNLALLYEKEGDTVKAEEYLTRARSLDPTIGK